MNASAQFTYPQFEVPPYLTVLLAAFPFSVFLVCLAISQSNIVSFYFCVYTACLVSGWLFMLVIQRENMTIEPIYKSVVRLNSPSRQYVNHKNWLWRSFNIRYAHVMNSESKLPVILLHGFGASIGHWRNNIPELAKHYDVYALDLLGFGASAKPAVNYSIQLWVEQVYEFWRTFIGVPVVLIGNSIGSVTCLAVASAHPEMVRGVAMISLPDTSSVEESIPAAIRPVCQSLKTIFTSSLVLKPMFYLLRHPCIIRKWAGLAYACKDAITDELLEILTTPVHDRNSAKAFCAILQGMIHPQFSPCVKSLLSNLHIPSLLLWGKCDRMIPPALSRRFLTYSPTLQLIEVENAGHCAHDECPERVNQELLTWIQTQIL